MLFPEGCFDVHPCSIIESVRFSCSLRECFLCGALFWSSVRHPTHESSKSVALCIALFVSLAFVFMSCSGLCWFIRWHQPCWLGCFSYAATLKCCFLWETASNKVAPFFITFYPLPACSRISPASWLWPQILDLLGVAATSNHTKVMALRRSASFIVPFAALLCSVSFSHSLMCIDL